MDASLHGQNQPPLAGKPWHYKVLAVGANGKAMAGSVVTEFMQNGAVIGRATPATHRLKNGRLSATVTFPAQFVGMGLALQVVVHTSAGTVMLDWPVNVQG